MKITRIGVAMLITLGLLLLTAHSFGASKASATSNGPTALSSGASQPVSNANSKPDYNAPQICNVDDFEQAGHLSGPRDRLAAAAFPNNGKVYAIGGYGNGAVRGTLDEYDPGTNAWTQRGNLQIAVEDTGAGVISGTIYVPGGDDNTFTPRHELQTYDPITNLSSVVVSDPLPSPIVAGAVAVANNKLYVIGGLITLTGTAVITNYQYDPNAPAGSRWSTRAALPTPVAYAAAATVDGLIYVAGGGGPSADLNIVQVYNPVSDSWTTAAHMLQARSGLALVGLNTSDPGGPALWAMGGGFSTYLSSTERFDPTRNSWMSGPNLLIGSRTIAGAYLNGVIYKMGGYDGSTHLDDAEHSVSGGGFGGFTVVQNQNVPRAKQGLVSLPLTGHLYALAGQSVSGTITNTVEEYDPSADTWTIRNPLQIAVSSTGAGVISNTIYVPGGFDGNVATNTLQTYNPIAYTSTVLVSDTLPSVVYSDAVAVANNKLYVMGGTITGTTLTTNYQYDPNAPAGSRWSSKAALPTAVADAAAATVDGKIYLVGGRNGNNLNIVQVYNPISDTWTTAAPLLLPRSGAAVVGLNTGDLGGPALIVLGGNFNGSLSETERYDPTTNTWTTSVSLQAAANYLSAAYLSGTVYKVGGRNGANGSDVEKSIYAACPPPLTPTPTLSPTNTPTPTQTPTQTPTLTPTDCPNPFVDISNDIFYGAIHYLNCRSVVNGTDATHFSPLQTSTRAQFAKIVVLAYGLTLVTPQTGPTFTDVQPSYFAYAYIETGYINSILSGYDQATCTANNAQYPCYLPNLAITRAQLTKLVVNAAHYPLITPTSGQTFVDVPSSNVFYVAIETAYAHHVINGYPGNLFLPNNPIQRDQMCQIVYEAVTHP